MNININTIPPITPTYTTNDALLFLMGQGKDGSGRTVAEYLQFDNNKWEDCHDHIQWAFPSSIASAFNPTAPVIDYDLFVKYIKGLSIGNEEQRGDYYNITHHITLLFTAYMESIGITDITENKPVGPKRIMWLLDPNDHNHRRISRVFMLMHHLKPVMSAGWNRVIDEMFLTITKQFCDSKAYKASTLSFWNHAYYNGRNP